MATTDDARGLVSKDGIYFSPESAYNAITTINEINSGILDDVYSIFSEENSSIFVDFELPWKQNSNYVNAFNNIKEFADYYPTFYTKFNNLIDNFLVIDPTFAYTLDFLMKTEGQAAELFHDDITEEEIATLYNEYYAICIFAEKTGREEAKKYYTLAELKESDFWCAYMEFSEIQYYACQEYGYEFGEFPRYSYQDFEETLVVYVDSSKGIHFSISYSDFTLSMPPSTYRYSYETCGKSIYGDKTNEELLNASDEYLADYLSWCILRNSDIQDKVIKECGSAKYKISDLNDDSEVKVSILAYVNETGNIKSFRLQFEPDFEFYSKPRDISQKIDEIKDRRNPDDMNITIRNDDDFVNILYSIITDSCDFIYTSANHGNEAVVWFPEVFTNDSGYEYSTVINFNDYYDDKVVWNNGVMSTEYGESTNYDNYIQWLSFLSESDKNVIRYLYAKEGTDAVMDYLDSISSSLDNRFVAEKTVQDQKYAQEHRVAASVASVFITPLEGIHAFGESLSSLALGEPIRQTDVYSSGDVYRSAVASSLGDVGGFLYSTGMSMVDSLVLTATNSLTGGVMSGFLSVAWMGSRVYVSTLNNALDRGLTDGQAVLLATSSAVVESLTEKAQVDRLLNLDVDAFPGMSKLLNSVSNNPAKYNLFKVIGGAIFEGAAEGSEELLSEALNTIFDLLIARDDSEILVSLRSKLAEGLSMSEAVLSTLGEFQKDLTVAYAGGFLSGLFMGGTFGAVNVVNENFNAVEVAEEIAQMYEDSTFKTEIKDLQLNLLKGEFNLALQNIIDLPGVDFSVNLLAANTLHTSMQNNFQMDANQENILNTTMNAAVEKFSKMDINDQLNQFNDLSVDNQAKLLEILGSKGIDLFKNLDVEQQKILFGKLSLNPTVQLDILLELNTKTQNALLPNNMNIQQFVLSNTKVIIANKLSSVDSDIELITFKLKKLLGSNITVVNDMTSNNIDKMIEQISKDPSKIDALLEKYQNNKNIDYDAFTKLVYELKDAANLRYNLTHIGDVAQAVVNSGTVSSLDQAIVSLLCPQLDVINKNENSNINPTSNVSLKMESIVDVAQYFGDSNLYLYGVMIYKIKNKLIEMPAAERKLLGSELYKNDSGAVEKVLTYLNDAELNTYYKLLSNQNNSIQGYWQSTLTDGEKKAVSDYAKTFGAIDAEDAFDIYGYDSNGSSYVTINDLMRAGLRDGNPDLDSAIEKFGVLPAQITTYRGAGLDALTSQFGEIDINHLDSLIGKVYTDKAYMSSTLLESKAAAAVGKKTDVIFKITVPNDSNYGAYIESLADVNYSQLEFLIKKNSTSVIEKAYVNEKGKIVIEMKLFNDNLQNVDVATDAMDVVATDDDSDIAWFEEDEVLEVVTEKLFDSSEEATLDMFPTNDDTSVSELTVTLKPQWFVPAGDLVTDSTLNEASVSEVVTEKLFDSSEEPTLDMFPNNDDNSVSELTVTLEPQWFAPAGDLAFIDTPNSLLVELSNLKSQLSNMIGMSMEQYLVNCASISQLDPVVQQQIQQYADSITSLAHSAEPEISAFLSSLATDGVKFAGFEHRFKSVSSISRKIAKSLNGSTNLADISYYANQINDSLRYTLILDEVNYSSQFYSRLYELMNEGYTIDWINNSWGNPIYQGINVSMTSPSGVKLELQFHTESSFNVKESLNHEYYEIFRSGYPSPEIKDLAGRIMKLNQQMNVHTITDMVGLDYNAILSNLPASRLYEKRVYKDYYANNDWDKNRKFYQMILSKHNEEVNLWSNSIKQDALLSKLFENYIDENNNYSPAAYSTVNALKRGIFIDHHNQTVSFLGTFSANSKPMSFSEFETNLRDKNIIYKGKQILTIKDFINMQEDAYNEINTKLNEFSLKENVIMYRGIHWNALTSLKDKNGISFGINENDSPDTILAKFQKFGSEYEDKSFMSASPSPVYITTSKPVILKMFCEQGTKGAFLEEVGGCEHEFLFPGGSKFDVFDVKIEKIEGKNTLVIYMKTKSK